MVLSENAVRFENFFEPYLELFLLLQIIVSKLIKSISRLNFAISLFF